MADVDSRLPTQDQADGAVGSAIPSEAVLVAGKDPTGNLQPLSLDSNKDLYVTQAGSSYFHSNFYGRVQYAYKATASNSNNLSVSLTSSSSAGNTIIVAVAVKGSALASLTDNLGQTYTLATSIATGTGTGAVYLYYCSNTLAGVTSVTATLGILVTDNISITVVEYSGLLTASALDKTSSNANVSTSWTSNSTATTTQAAELLFGIAYDKDHNNNTLSPGTGWTSVATNSGQNVVLFCEDQIVGTTGTYAATGTCTANDHIYAIIGTFKLNTSITAGLFTNNPSNIKSSTGTLKNITINSSGDMNATLTIYDTVSSPSNTNKIAVIDLAAVPTTLSYNLNFNSGLTVLANSSTSDFTITYT